MTKRQRLQFDVSSGHMTCEWLAATRRSCNVVCCDSMNETNVKCAFQCIYSPSVAYNPVWSFPLLSHTCVKQNGLQVGRERRVISAPEHLHHQTHINSTTTLNQAPSTVPKRTLHDHTHIQTEMTPVVTEVDAATSWTSSSVFCNMSTLWQNRLKPWKHIRNHSWQIKKLFRTFKKKRRRCLGKNTWGKHKNNPTWNLCDMN